MLLVCNVRMYVLLQSENITIIASTVFALKIPIMCLKALQPIMMSANNQILHDYCFSQLLIVLKICDIDY